MTRSFGGALLALFAAFAIAACTFEEEDGDEDGHGHGHGYEQPDCTQYKTCGACTWIVGCGWCFSGSGPEGVCAPGPESCTKAGSKWNWEPIGCHVAADPGDGGGASDGATGD